MRCNKIIDEIVYIYTHIYIHIAVLQYTECAFTRGSNDGSNDKECAEHAPNYTTA